MSLGIEMKTMKFSWRRSRPVRLLALFILCCMALAVALNLVYGRAVLLKPGELLPGVNGRSRVASCKLKSEPTREGIGATPRVHSGSRQRL
jgi:hypothetical protein